MHASMLHVRTVEQRRGEGSGGEADGTSPPPLVSPSPLRERGPHHIHSHPGPHDLAHASTQACAPAQPRAYLHGQAAAAKYTHTDAYT
jgi:hypothetical protein